MRLSRKQKSDCTYGRILRTVCSLQSAVVAYETLTGYISVGCSGPRFRNVPIALPDVCVFWYAKHMPTYVYETVSKDPSELAKRYEIWQRMQDEPLTRHPETGEPIKRVLIGGIGLPGSITDRSADRKRD